MTKKPSIIFMGTPDFAVPSLKRLAETCEIKAVYTGKERPQGRGMALTQHPIHDAAEKLNLKVFTPPSLDDEVINQIASLKPDFIITVAYGLILPQSIIDIPSKAALNGHASLLPRWRGANPILRAIEAGDEITGITIMLMEEKLDSGAILLSFEEAIDPDDTTASLTEKLAEMTAELLVKAVTNFDDLTPTPQDESKVTWAKKTASGEAQINFDKPSEAIKRHVNAFAPRAWFSADGNRILVHKIAIVDKVEKAPHGTFIGTDEKGAPLIASQDGAVALRSIQPKGKSVMSGRDFLNGNTLPKQIIRRDE